MSAASASTSRTLSTSSISTARFSGSNPARISAVAGEEAAPAVRGEGVDLVGLLLVMPDVHARRSGRHAGHGEAADGPAAAFHQSLYIGRSEEHTSELQSLMRLSYAVFCLNKKT